MLESPPLARAPETGLNLVGDEQGAVLAAERLCPLEVIVRGEMDTFALHGLHDEGGHVAPTQGLLQGGQVAEVNPLGVSEERAQNPPGNWRCQ